MLPVISALTIDALNCSQFSGLLTLSCSAVILECGRVCQSLFYYFIREIKDFKVNRRDIRAFGQLIEIS